MHPTRIAALLEPFLESPLSPNQLDQISTYIDLLLRWNARINLTAIRDPEQIVPRHFGESLFMARHLFPSSTVNTERAPFIAPFAVSENPEPAAAPAQLQTRDSRPLRLIDLGSGAGFPALPIKIWAPHIHLTMIESNHKKATFLREAVRVLTLTNVDVIAERAESVAARLPSATGSGRSAGAATSEDTDSFQPAEVVTFRAVEKFNEILPTAKRFLAPNARLAILITETQLKHMHSSSFLLAWTVIHVPQSQQGLLAISGHNGQLI
jgi:16S rRNA (guanine(527)-N(7))-methyltransferase RsmG